MKFNSAYISVRNGEYHARAEVFVEGLGEVKIDCALSDELSKRIEEEAIASLRSKLGQMIAT